MELWTHPYEISGLGICKIPGSTPDMGAQASRLRKATET